MPKLPILTPKRLVKILEKFGFRLDRKTGSHFIFYNPENKKRAVIPYRTKDLPKGTILSILKQAGIGKKDIREN